MIFSFSVQASVGLRSFHITLPWNLSLQHLLITRLHCCTLYSLCSLDNPVRTRQNVAIVSTFQMFVVRKFSCVYVCMCVHACVRACVRVIHFWLIPGAHLPSIPGAYKDRHLLSIALKEEYFKLKLSRICLVEAFRKLAVPMQHFHVVDSEP